LLGSFLLTDCNGDDSKTKCKLSGKCYSSADRCDGYKDCAIRDANYEIVTEDDADEENCPVGEEEGPIINEPIVDDNDEEEGPIINEPIVDDNDEQYDDEVAPPAPAAEEE